MLLLKKRCQQSREASRILKRMKAALKGSLRSVINVLGYDLVHRKYLASLVTSMEHCGMMRKIHFRDAIEIEELYRQFVFPDLSRRDGRAELLYELIGTSIGEGVYIIHHLHEAMGHPGDICEFGVAQGATSRLLASEMLFAPERKLWLFDSFAGLPAPGPEDELIDDIFNLGSMRHYEGTMVSPESEVLSKLRSIGFPEDRIKVKKGWLNETIRTADLPGRVAFAYVDLDFYDPIREALQFVDGNIQVGGRIIVDDYGFFSAGAKLAVDRFVAGARDRYRLEVAMGCAGHFCILSRIA
jgi:O-methyltransferase